MGKNEEQNGLFKAAKGFISDTKLAAIPQYMASPLPKDHNMASEFYKRLIKWVNEFDGSLEQNYETGVKLVNFGQACTFHLEDISYWNPSLIKFIGKTDDGNQVELIQHVTQISVMLVKMERPNPEKPKTKIGFRREE